MPGWLFYHLKSGNKEMIRDVPIFSDDIRGNNIPLRVVLIGFSNLNIFSKSDELDAEFSNAVKETLSGFTLDNLSIDKSVRNVRQLFKSFGTDPTRWRPSSEAMIRRILKDKTLFRINSLVDINNIISIRYRLPIGLYDLDKVKGRIKLGIGRDDLSFVGLTGREYNTDGKPVVMDDLGVIGSPIVDSDRTKIIPETSNALAIIFSSKDESFTHSLNAGKDFASFAARFHPESKVEEPFLLE
jgi:DNA/RNA-binding domain of Phe-tRNA-synthetase-like protein